jgi:hypothetical protein
MDILGGRRVAGNEGKVFGSWLLEAWFAGRDTRFPDGSVQHDVRHEV